jgi:hypothetical protein
MSRIETPSRQRCSVHPAVGKVGMADYRAYTVGLDGHFINFQAFSCADDPDAIERARQFVEGRAVELWSGERFVARLEQRKAE